MQVKKFRRGLTFFLRGTQQQNIKTRQRLWTTLLFFAVLLVLTVDFGYRDVNLEVGQISNITIKSPTFIEVTDLEKTEKLRHAAANKVAKAYDLDVRVIEQVIGEIQTDLRKIKEIRNSQAFSNEQKILQLQEIVNKDGEQQMSEQEINALLLMKNDDFDRLENIAKEVVLPVLKSGLKEEDLDAGKMIVIQQLRLQKLESYQRKLLECVILPKLKPSLIYNKQLTEQRIAEAQNNVPEARKRIEKDQIIISKGETVTPQHIIELEALGLQRTPFNYRVVLGLAILLLILLAVVGVYLFLYKKDILENERFTLLLGIISLFILILAKTIYSVAANSHFAGYLIPIAAGSMLIAILLDRKLAILVAIVLGILVGIITGYQYNFMVIYVISGIAGVFSVSRLSQRGDLIRAGFINSGVNFLIIFALGLLENVPVLGILKASFLGLVNGIASAVLAGGVLPFLEVPFGILTEPKLLELSNPNHPILKKLLVEAPGTYHHSIIVGNLAEAATEAVGGSPLLARVGAYYHDIGKIKRPYFFIENQLTQDNPHDKLAPSLSTLVITSHIKDGIEMAKKYRLPSEIIDIIRQHHGDSLLSYFYHRALENEKNEKLLESDFRYPGPKPQTKEAAIVMLADSIEAAVRSMSRPTQGVIESLVRKIVRDKLNDGQLDDSDLTLKDLEKIIDAFLKVLSGIFHSRIEYPDDKELRELERRKSNGRSNN